MPKQSLSDLMRQAARLRDAAVIASKGGTQPAVNADSEEPIRYIDKPHAEFALKGKALPSAPHAHLVTNPGAANDAEAVIHLYRKDEIDTLADDDSEKMADDKGGADDDTDNSESYRTVEEAGASATLGEKAIHLLKSAKNRQEFEQELNNLVAQEVKSKAYLEKGDAVKGLENALAKHHQARYKRNN